MKKFLLISMISMFILSSCTFTLLDGGIVPTPAGSAAPGVMNEIVGSEILSSTPSPVPTGTPDHDATMSVYQTKAENDKQAVYAAQQASIHSQETTVAGNVAIAAFTAQYDNNQIEKARIQKAMDDAKETHVYETQTAQPTAAAGTATQQALIAAVLTFESSKLTAAVEAPALMRKMTDAENDREWGWLSYITNAVFVAAAIMLFVWIALYLNRRPLAQETAVPAAQFKDLNKAENIPMAAPDPQTPQYTIRSEFLCTPEQLVALAKGWVEEKKTAAYNKWRGIIPDSTLYEIREVLIDFKYAYELVGKHRELSYTKEGEGFMEYTAAHGKPPEPFVCLLTTSPTSDEGHKSGIIPLTGIAGQASE